MSANQSPKRLLLIYQGYGQVTKTYIENEVEDLARDYEILILNVYRSINRRSDKMHPFIDCRDLTFEELLEIAVDFHPDHIHGQYLHLSPLLRRLASKLSISFSIRGHSSDILEPEKMGTNRFPVSESISALKDERCTGFLAMPFAVPVLKAWGAPEEKIVTAPPVFNFDLFFDRGVNGSAIMNIGAALPKKNMSDYLMLAHSMPEHCFDLYGVGFDLDRLQQQNLDLGGKVNIKEIVPYRDMHREYKKHAWLVYTADTRVNSVGWPIALAEAQAAGVGVCMQNLRPDLKLYLQDTAILFDSISDLPKILKLPPSADMREKAFENARLLDYKHHRSLLTDLFPWNHTPRATA